MGLIRDIWCETDIRWLFVKQCCPVFISTSGSSFAFSKHSRRITPFKKKSLSLSHTHRYCGHYISSHRAVANSQRGPALESHIYMQPSSPLALSLLRSLFHRSEVFHILWIHTFLSICCSQMLLYDWTSSMLYRAAGIPWIWDSKNTWEETGFAQIQAAQEDPKATTLL